MAARRKDDSAAGRRTRLGQRAAGMGKVGPDTDGHGVARGSRRTEIQSAGIHRENSADGEGTSGCASQTQRSGVGRGDRKSSVDGCQGTEEVEHCRLASGVPGEIRECLVVAHAGDATGGRGIADDRAGRAGSPCGGRDDPVRGREVVLIGPAGRAGGERQRPSRPGDRARIGDGAAHGRCRSRAGRDVPRRPCVHRQTAGDAAGGACLPGGVLEGERRSAVGERQRRAGWDIEVRSGDGLTDRKCPVPACARQRYRAASGNEKLPDRLRGHRSRGCRAGELEDVRDCGRRACRRPVGRDGPRRRGGTDPRVRRCPCARLADEKQ